MKFNIDVNEVPAGEYGIAVIPTLMLFKDDSARQGVSGARRARCIEIDLGLREVVWIGLTEDHSSGVVKLGFAVSLAAR